VEKNSASYKFEKRKKEIARQKKQEEKRQRQIDKKQGKQEEMPLVFPDGTPIIPLEEIDTQIHLDDSTDPID
jgi:nitrate reductase cytochrome c-type subunit